MFWQTPPNGSVAEQWRWPSGVALRCAGLDLDFDFFAAFGAGRFAARLPPFDFRADRAGFALLDFFEDLRDLAGGLIGILHANIEIPV